MSFPWHKIPAAATGRSLRLSRGETHRRPPLLFCLSRESRDCVSHLHFDESFIIIFHVAIRLCACVCARACVSMMRERENGDKNRTGKLNLLTATTSHHRHHHRRHPQWWWWLFWAKEDFIFLFLERWEKSYFVTFCMILRINFFSIYRLTRITLDLAE